MQKTLITITESPNQSAYRVDMNVVIEENGNIIAYLDAFTIYAAKAAMNVTLTKVNGISTLSVAGTPLQISEQNSVNGQPADDIFAVQDALINYFGWL